MEQIEGRAGQGVVREMKGREGQGVVMEMEGRSWRGHQENENTRKFIT